MLALVLIKLVWAAWIENVTTPRAQEILNKELRMELYQKAVELDLEQYDDPKFYNEFVWSINEAATRMDLILQDFGSFLNHMARIVANGVFFVTLDTFGIVFILISLAVTLVLQDSFHISRKHPVAFFFLIYQRYNSNQRFSHIVSANRL